MSSRPPVTACRHRCCKLRKGRPLSYTAAFPRQYHAPSKATADRAPSPLLRRGRGRQTLSPAHSSDTLSVANKGETAVPSHDRRNPKDTPQPFRPRGMDGRGGRDGRARRSYLPALVVARRPVETSTAPRGRTLGEWRRRDRRLRGARWRRGRGFVSLRNGRAVGHQGFLKQKVRAASRPWHR